MKRTRILPLLFAAALQVMPLGRVISAAPAVGSTFAIICRWVMGATAGLGAFDAVSGATAVVFTTPTNYAGTVGTYFTNFTAIINNGGDPGAFFVLTNKSGVSTALTNGNTTTICLPPGLTFRCVDPNNGGSPKLIYGAIFGTPTTPVTNHWIHVLVGYTGQIPAQTDIFLTFSQVVTSAPVITNQPAGVTNVAGSPAAFSVLAGGTAPLAYQWRKSATNNLPNATNSSYSIPNLHLSHAGDYTVVISNSVGSVTSAVAKLAVTMPPAPVLNLSPPLGNQFQFTFVPVVGLTNTVSTNGSLNGGTWLTMTNIPPPATSAAVTVTDSMAGNRFYRVQFSP